MPWWQLFTHGSTPGTSQDDVPYLFFFQQVLSGTLDEQKKQREKFLKSLVRQASNKMLGELISGGANIDCQRYDGMTPLLQALSQVREAHQAADYWKPLMGESRAVVDGLTDQQVLEVSGHRQ